ncbi:hypothetical protein D9M69_687310 [compost metagenome]
METQMSALKKKLRKILIVILTCIKLLSCETADAPTSQHEKPLPRECAVEGRQ